jgi:SsrA-binding protein
MRKENRRAKFDYHILETLEAGVVLEGGEVKAIKSGKVDINAAHIRILEGEAYLINANIPVGGKKNHSPTRTRKLLLHKDELISVSAKIKAKKLTLVPVSVYTKGRLVKVKIALAKAKRKFEKRQKIKKRDIERDIERELK